MHAPPTDMSRMRAGSCRRSPAKLMMQGIAPGLRLVRRRDEGSSAGTRGVGIGLAATADGMAPPGTGRAAVGVGLTAAGIGLAGAGPGIVPETDWRWASGDRTGAAVLGAAVGSAPEPAGLASGSLVGDGGEVCSAESTRGGRDDGRCAAGPAGRTGAAIRLERRIVSVVAPSRVPKLALGFTIPLRTR